MSNIDYSKYKNMRFYHECNKTVDIYVRNNPEFKSQFIDELKHFYTHHKQADENYILDAKAIKLFYYNLFLNIVENR